MLRQDYIYAVTPILEDALMDRDLVHRPDGIKGICDAFFQHVSMIKLT